MGGTVAVTLRKNDGTEYRMNRWTNSMPWGICNLRMLNGDEKHINAYMEQWLEMRDDYERNKDSGVFENNMTDAYFPSDGLAPCGYGLVVVDHVNKVILEMQGYTSFDTINAASISLEMSGHVLGIKSGDNDSDYIRFKELWDAGRITQWMTDKSPAPIHCKTRAEAYLPIDRSFDEVIKLLGEWPQEFRVYDFLIDLGDWKLESFDEYDGDGLKAMRERILELGFVLTDEENAIWNEWIEEYADE